MQPRRACCWTSLATRYVAKRFPRNHRVRPLCEQESCPITGLSCYRAPVFVIPSESLTKIALRLDRVIHGSDCPTAMTPKESLHGASS